MTRSLFDTLGTSERQLAQDRTDAMTAMLMRWAQRYPSVRTARVPSVALLTSIVAPRVSPIDMLASAKLVFWIFGADDIVGEGTVSLEEFGQRATDWCHLAADDAIWGIDQDDELLNMLIEIKRELFTCPLFESLHESWATELRRVTDGMIQECRMAAAYAVDGPSALPSIDEYVRWGLHSVGVPLWSWAVWSAIGDPSIQEYLDPIVKAAEHAGAAVRLYNDLRTSEKGQGKENVNSVLIAYQAMLGDDPGAPVGRVISQARQRVMQLAVSHGQKCGDLLREVHTDSGIPEEVLVRTIAFSHYFYGQRRRDTYLASTRGIYELLGQRGSLSSKGRSDVAKRF